MNDREQALETVERMRAHAVDRARSQVAEQMRALELSEVLLRECQVAHVSAAQRLSQALRSHAALCAPKELVWAERHARALQLDRESARLRLLRAQAQREGAEAKVTEARTRLRELELDRRAVAKVLERGRSEAALVRSRRQDDENDDAFRARKG